MAAVIGNIPARLSYMTFSLNMVILSMMLFHDPPSSLLSDTIFGMWSYQVVYFREWMNGRTDALIFPYTVPIIGVLLIDIVYHLSSFL